MTLDEIPTDRQVVETLAQFGEPVTARRLCDALVEQGHPVRKSALAIQRTAERGLIDIQADWRLRVAERALAA